METGIVTSQMVLLFGRLVSKPAVHATAAVAALPLAAAGMHAVGFNTDPDMAALASGMLAASFWLALGMAALFGSLGGVVAELLSLRGHIELPHRVKPGKGARRSYLGDQRHELDLGILSRMLLGAAAGLALLAIYAPTSATALVVNALIAGSAATGVFRVVQARMLGGDGSAARNARTTTKRQLSVVPEPQSAAA